MKPMRRLPVALMALLAALTFSPIAKAGEATVRVAPVDDLKAVVASVEPAHQLTARARMP